MRRLCVLAAMLSVGCAGTPRGPDERRAEERGAEARRSDEAGADDPDRADETDRADGLEPAAPPLGPDEPFVLTEGECAIRVGPIASFEVFRGGYRSAEWMSRLPPDEREMAESEDHYEAHGRCVLEVEVAGARRRYLHIVSGFVVAGPDPSREECLAEREAIARHLLVMTEGCRDPDGRGTLTVP